MMNEIDAREAVIDKAVKLIGNGGCTGTTTETGNRVIEVNEQLWFDLLHAVNQLLKVEGRLAAQLQVLRDLLLRGEWAIRVHNEIVDDDGDACYWCSGIRSLGHQPLCPLAKALNIPVRNAAVRS